MTDERNGTHDAGVDLKAYDAWLFDMDGVLTKTAAVHAAAWKEAFDNFLRGETARTGTAYAPFDVVSDYEKYVDGEPREDGVRNFLAARNITLPEGADDDAPSARTVHGLGNAKNDLVLQVMKAQGVALFDGVAALLHRLREQGTKVGVVSASENTKAALASAGIGDQFDVVVDGHVVKDRHLAGKPAPDSYLEGASILAVAPARCVVLEDALAGVEAGRAGHFGLVIGVDHHDAAGESTYASALRAHGADVVVTNLADLLGDGSSDSTSSDPLGGSR